MAQLAKKAVDYYPEFLNQMSISLNSFDGWNFMCITRSSRKNQRKHKTEINQYDVDLSIT